MDNQEDNNPYSHNPGEDWNKANRSGELKKQEDSFYHKESSSKTGGKILDRGGLYHAESNKGLAKTGIAAAANITPVGRALKYVGNHKKGAGLFGGGITGLILLFVAFFGFLGAHELVTIEQDMMRYEEKGVSYIEKKAGQKLFQTMACRKMSAIPGCKKVNEEDGGNDPAEQDADPMAAEMDKFSFSDPKIIDGLKTQNIEVNFDKEGNPSGLTDLETGQPITASDLLDPEYITRFQNAIPQWQTSQEETLRPQVINDAGATEDVITNPNDDNVNKEIEDSVDGADQGQQLAEAQAEDEAKPSESSSAAAEDASLTASNSSILDAADGVIESGGSEESAVSAAQSAAHLGSAALLNTALSDLCSIDKVATKSSNSRVPTIISFLIRHSVTLFSLADEMKVGGAMSGTQIGKVTQLFNGNPKDYTTNTKNTTKLQATLPFDRAAAWRRITGQPVDTNPNSPGYNPDISRSVLPQANTGTGVVNEINSALAATVVGPLVCKAESNSIISGVISAGFLVAQLYLDEFSFGSTQAVFTVATVGIQGIIKYSIIPTIVKYFTPAAMDGLESSVQWINNADAGSNLMFNLFAMRMGGKPLTGAQAVAMDTQGNKLQQIAQSQQSFFDRTFSFSNPNSLMSKLAVDIPTSKFAFINSIVSDIINAPSMLFHAVGSILEGARVYAASTPANPGQPYGITQYGFNPGEINKYNPIANEWYLFHTKVSFAGTTRTLINLMGNPNNYPRANYDPSSVDVLHCFTQSYINNSNPSASPAAKLKPDPICGTMGSFDINHDPPVAIGPNQVATSFCDQFPPPPPDYTGPPCMQVMLSTPAVITAMSHFRQYLLDDEVAGFYNSLENSQ